MSAIAADPIQSARGAGLRYVSDAKPGIRRIRCGKGFRYRNTDGSSIRDPETLRRIRSLAIPPAWKNVWICPYARGHLQATGRDTKGRKQSRYHPRWREIRDETKYERMLAFGAALPEIRRQVEHDLALPGMPRRKILATVVRLMEATFIRIGGDEFTAKDFRTWAGTVLTCAALRQLEPFGSETEAKKNIIEAINRVASRLGNTRAVCRKCYVHPAVLDCYLAGAMPEAFSRNGLEKSALNHDESELLRLLKQRSEQPAK
jgi:DNA topoisomerase IB